MNFLKKIFKSSEELKKKEIENETVSLSLDDSFVHEFIDKGGKFLYCLDKQDVTKNLNNIIAENHWEDLTIKSEILTKYTSAIEIKTNKKFNKDIPLFTTCEHLISENGSILFSSNQIEDMRLSTLTKDFIVFATTSQIVKDKDESLTGIKQKYKKEIPANISPVKNYDLNIKDDDDFMTSGNNNSKNLYLLLLEDL